MVSTYHVILTQLLKQSWGLLLCLGSKRQNFSKYFSVSLSVILVRVQVLYTHVHSTVCRFCLVPDDVSSIAENVHIS